MSARVHLLGIPLDALTLDETVERCADLVRAERSARQVSINAAKLVNIQDDPRLAEVVRGCDLVSPDGQAVVWAARLLGLSVPERVPGIDLMARLLAVAEAEGWPVFFLGARAEILESFVRAARERHPRLMVAGSHHGYFDDDAAMVDVVRASGARLLFVGMPSPRKEFFLAEGQSRLGPLLAMGVGGSFDVWAGRWRRAPRWMRRAGLEWLFRLGQEPRRLWRRYLVGNTRFVRLVMRARLGRRGK